MMDTENVLDKKFMARKWKARYDALPDEIKQQIDWLREADVEEYQLQVIKRKRTYPEIGDIFKLCPCEDIEYYGIVVNNHVNNNNGNDQIVIFIFRSGTDIRQCMKNGVRKEDLLIKPEIVSKSYWTMGYFFNVDHIEIQPCDYGFFSISWVKFMDEYGNEISEEPYLLGIYGIVTMSGIAYMVNREMIISGIRQFKPKERILTERAGKLQAEIDPFTWEETDEEASVLLDVGEYLQEIFDTRADEGAEGNGYDWSSLAQVFLDEKCQDLRKKINFDPEAGMFCAYSEDKAALEDFILRFRKACDDKALITELFSRAQLE